MCPGMRRTIATDDGSDVEYGDDMQHWFSCMLSTAYLCPYVEPLVGWLVNVGT